MAFDLNAAKLCIPRMEFEGHATQTPAVELIGETRD
jgi:hypothetical protein